MEPWVKAYISMVRTRKSIRNLDCDEGAPLHNAFYVLVWGDHQHDRLLQPLTTLFSIQRHKKGPVPVKKKDINLKWTLE